MERSSRPRRLVLRAAPAAAALGLALGLLGPSAARSDSDFGTLGLDRSVFGSLVSLSTPSSRLFQEADEFVVHRTVVQSRSSTDPGLIQVGVYRSGPGIELDNCGTSAAYVTFTEVKSQGSMAYRCQLYRQVPPGRVLVLDLFRFRTPASWGIRIDGAAAGPVYPLGFARGTAAIGTEIQDVDGNYATRTATRFGPSGHAAWSVYTTLGRTRRHAVVAADPTFAFPTSDRFWWMTHGPGRLTVKHRA